MALNLFPLWVSVVLRFFEAFRFSLIGQQHMLCIRKSPGGHTFCGVSPSKGTEGDLFITYVVVDNASAQNVLGSIACASILRTLSIMVRFILLASPFSSNVFGTVNSSRIPFERQYSLNSRVEFLEDGQHLVLRLQWCSPQSPVVVVYERYEVLRSGM